MNETNEHDQQQSSMSHSISDNLFPISSSNDNFLNTNGSTSSETPK